MDFAFVQGGMRVHRLKHAAALGKQRRHDRHA